MVVVVDGTVVVSVVAVVSFSHDTLQVSLAREAEQSANLHHSGSEQETVQTLTASWLEQSTASHHSGSPGLRKCIILHNSFVNFVKFWKKFNIKMV